MNESIFKLYLISMMSDSPLPPLPNGAFEVHLFRYLLVCHLSERGIWVAVYYKTTTCWLKKSRDGGEKFNFGGIFTESLFQVIELRTICLDKSYICNFFGSENRTKCCFHNSENEDNSNRVDSSAELRFGHTYARWPCDVIAAASVSWILAKHKLACCCS